jgi:hypothetical protein
MSLAISSPGAPHVLLTVFIDGNDISIQIPNAVMNTKVDVAIDLKKSLLCDALNRSSVIFTRHAVASLRRKCHIWKRNSVYSTNIFKKSIYSRTVSSMYKQ